MSPRPPRITRFKRPSAARIAYRASVATLRKSGALKAPGTIWPELQEGNYLRGSTTPGDPDQQSTPSGFVRLHGGAR